MKYKSRKNDLSRNHILNSFFELSFQEKRFRKSIKYLTKFSRVKRGLKSLVCNTIDITINIIIQIILVINK